MNLKRRFEIRELLTLRSRLLKVSLDLAILEHDVAAALEDLHMIEDKQHLLDLGEDLEELSRGLRSRDRIQGKIKTLERQLVA